MSDDELLKLMLQIDPQTKRVPPGIRAIANAVEMAERERCARIVDDTRAAIWPYHDPTVKQTAETVCENLANRIRGVGA